MFKNEWYYFFCKCWKKIYIIKDYYKYVFFSDIGSKLKVGRGGLDIRNCDFVKEERSDFVYNICGVECYYDF